MPAPPRRNRLPDPRAAAVSALLLLGPPAAALPALAPAESPALVIRSLEAISGDDRAEIHIGCDRRPVWTARAEGDLELALWIAASVAGPEVRDLEPAAGLIAAVRVGPGEGSAAGTRIGITSRRPVGSSTGWSDGRLTVVLRPLEGRRSRIEPETPDAPGAGGAPRVVRASPCLNLRMAPTTAGRTLECLPTGIRVASLEENRGWTRIRTADGRDGWVSSEYLDPEAAASPAPEAPQPASTPTVAAASAPDPPAAEPPAAPAEPAPVAAETAPSPSLSAHAASEPRIAVLESRVAELSRERDGLVRRIDALQTSARAAEASSAQVERLQAELDQVAAERDGLRGRAEASAERAEAADAAAARATGLEARVAELASERDELARRIDTLQDSAEAGADTSAEAERLRARLDQVAAERDALARRVEQLESRAAAAEAAETEVERLRRQLASVEADRNALRRRLESLEASAPPARPAEPPREDGGILVRPPLAQQPPVVARPPLAAGEPVAERPAGERNAAEEVAAAIAAWADAWSGQRVADYLAFYAPDFRTPDGLDRSAWEAQRRQRLTRPRSIEVEIRDLAVRLDGADRAEARFDQSYRSDVFADRVTKILEMGRRGGVWRILAERAEP